MASIVQGVIAVGPVPAVPDWKRRTSLKIRSGRIPLSDELQAEIERLACEQKPIPRQSGSLTPGRTHKFLRRGKRFKRDRRIQRVDRHGLTLPEMPAQGSLWEIGALTSEMFPGFSLSLAELFAAE